MSRHMRLGVALSPDRLVAVLPDDGNGTPWQRDLRPAEQPGAPSPELGEALTALRSAFGARDGILHVALLPPLAILRRVSLPGLRVDEARQVLAREPSRYLAVAAAAPLALEVEGTGWRGSSPFSVFAAPRALVDAIHAAAHAAGWRVAEIVAAEAAWAAGSSSMGTRAGGTEHHLIVCLDDRVEVLRVRARRVVGMRRFPRGAPDFSSLILAALRDGGASDAAPLPAASLIGSTAVAAELRAALSRRGLAFGIPRPDAPPLDSPAALAARFAPDAAGPALLDDGERAAAARASRRHSVARLAAAALLLAAAGVVQLWGTSRERTSIAEQRARLRGQVAGALATRESLSAATQRLALLRTAAVTAPRWSALLVGLSAELPESSFLLSLRADGDSLRLEGSAARAAGVFEALDRLPGVRSVRPDGPIRQDVKAGGPTTEHFAITVSLGSRP